MVFFSTYRSKRLVANTFMQAPVMRMRAFADYYFQRAWNGTLMWVVPGDVRFWAVCIPVIYFIHRWQSEHTLDTDAYEKAMILRWGGSLEEARKLSPQDQLRVRSFVDMEKLYSSYGPKEATIQPDGSTLPGKGYYHAAGAPAH